MIYKTLHRKLKIEQHESNLKWGWNQVRKGLKDTKEANKYMLTHQDVDSAGELETQLIKVRGHSWIYN
jgi:hypothetical protein